MFKEAEFKAGVRHEGDIKTGVVYRLLRQKWNTLQK